MSAKSPMSPHELQRQLQAVTIYIPVPASQVDILVDAGSGVVGYINADQVLVGYMEGNRLGASNMHRYEERIKHAAGRLFEAYPTIARFWLPAAEMPDNLIEVGRITRDYTIEFTRPGLAKAYGAPVGSVLETNDGREFVKTLSGLWYDGHRFISRFDEPEGTFTVKEHAPVTT